MRKSALKFSFVPGQFAVCRLAHDADFPDILHSSPFVSVTRSTDELSIVCPADHAPAGAKTETGWACFKLIGPFPFAQTGVLASFIGPLAEGGVPVFAVSTFDTDYVLVKAEYAGHAMGVLRAAGHEMVP
jgi:hypothetical protein